MLCLLAYLAPEQPDDISKATLNAINAAPVDTYFLASLMMNIVNWLLGLVGLEHNQTIVTWTYAVVVFVVSIAIGYIAKWLILGGVRRLSRHWDNDLYRFLRQEMFFTKMCRMIPAIVFLIFIQFTLVSIHNRLADILTRLTLLYVIYVTVMALSAFIGAVWANIDTKRNKKHLPLRGLVQLIRGIIWIIAVIIAVAVLVNKSPASLLAGLGAFAAVLMLVFKDSILGLVAGVQLSENDSLHVGDWIKVNGTDANGTVVEVSLTAVKVLNWDKTTTMLPPYSLVSGSFTNYRSMQVSNTRRILRTFMIDADSVVPLTPDMLEEFRSIPFMDNYITRKLAQKAAGKVEDVNNSEGLADGTIDTNLGLFRAYMRMWLDNNEWLARG
ncbi:MAG: mechanosensitive ion channel family protein, partial [Muribaculum sp.]